MNNEGRRRFSPPAVGGSSLLVIFAVLCLTIFALLSMSTVQADGRLGDAAANAISGYYAADTQAETILAQLRQGQVPPEVTLEDVDDVLTATYTCPISNTQSLYVSVAFPEGLGDSYSIQCWQSIFSGTWDPNDHLNVWDGT